VSPPAGRGRLLAWVAASLLGAAALWVMLDLRSSLRQQQQRLDERAASEEGQRLAADQRLGAAVAEAVERAAAEHAAAQAELTARLDAAQGELESVKSERDRALADLAQAGGDSATLRERVAALEAQQAQLQQKLDAAEAGRLAQVGEASRLLDQVLERDRRLDVLNHSLAELREQEAAGQRPPSVVTVGRGDALAPRLNEALRRSGATHAVLLEAGLAADGTLHDVLARLTEDGQPARVIASGHAALSFSAEGVSLRLDELGGEASGGGTPIQIDLPAFDADAWSSAGVAVPVPYRVASRVSVALSELLERFGWQVDGLRGVDGATLLGVELTQLDGPGKVLRSVKAPRAALTPGPELTLWDGAVITGEDERAFFDGVFRLPLPGLDATAWQAALSAGAR